MVPGAYSKVDPPDTESQKRSSVAVPLPFVQEIEKVCGEGEEMETLVGGEGEVEHLTQEQIGTPIGQLAYEKTGRKQRRRKKRNRFTAEAPQSWQCS